MWDQLCCCSASILASRPILLLNALSLLKRTIASTSLSSVGIRHYSQFFTPGKRERLACLSSYPKGSYVAHE